MKGRESLLLPALRFLLWAVVVEVLLVRLFSRVGIYMPKSGTFLQAYEGALFVGESAFNLSLMLGALLVIYWAVTARQWLLVLAAGGLLLAPGAAAPMGWSLGVTLATFVALTGLGARAVRQGESMGMVAGMLVVLLVHLLGYAVNGAQLGWGLLSMPGALPGAGLLLRLGELLALLAPLLLAGGAQASGSAPARAPAPQPPAFQPSALEPPAPEPPALQPSVLEPPAPEPPAARSRVAPSWMDWVAGLGGALALAFAYWVNPDMTAILAMYSLGFTLSWPAFLYLVALGAVIPAMRWLLRTHPARGLALGTLFLAGYGPSVNQQHLLVLAAWATLALSSAHLEHSIAPQDRSSTPLTPPLAPQAHAQRSTSAPEGSSHALKPSSHALEPSSHADEPSSHAHECASGTLERSPEQAEVAT